MLINGYVSDEKLNQEEVLLVHAINSVGCKNYGLTADIVDKYPYAETAGRRYCDSDLKCIAREDDRTPEGSCLIRPSPLYIKGPKIASLVTQFGLGRPYEENRLAQKIVRSCGQESFAKHLRHDTSENRLIHFNSALKSLSASLKTSTCQDTNKVVLPIGIGCSGVSEKWLCRYYEIIKKFAQDISHNGIHCYIAVRKQHLYTIDRYVHKKRSQKAQLQLKELKSLAWKDVDDRWFNDLINKKKRNYYTTLREVIVQISPTPLHLLIAPLLTVVVVVVVVVVTVIVTKSLWMLIMLMLLMMVVMMMMMTLIKPSFMLVWVDDIIIAASNDNVPDTVKKSLKEAFKTEDMGKLSWFLGI